MSMLRPQGTDGAGLVRCAGPGDVLMAGEAIQALTTVGAGTITAALMMTGILRRTGPAGGYTDTFDSAANIVAAMAGQTGNNANVLPGSSFRFMFINGVAQAMTAAAGTGIVLGTNVNVAASIVREYLVSVISANPPTLFGMDTVNADATLVFTNTGLSVQQQLLLLDSVDIGMTVIGTGIPTGTTILEVDFINRRIELSANATGTASNVPLTFTPTVRIDGLRAGTA